MRVIPVATLVASLSFIACSSEDGASISGGDSSDGASLEEVFFPDVEVLTGDSAGDSGANDDTAADTGAGDSGADGDDGADTSGPCNTAGCACTSNADCLDELCVAGPTAASARRPA